MPELADRIRDLIDGGVEPVTFDEILQSRQSSISKTEEALPSTAGEQLAWDTKVRQASLQKNHPSRWRPTRRIVAIVGVAAAALALTLTFFPGGSSVANALQLVRSSPNVALNSAPTVVVVSSTMVDGPGGTQLATASGAGRIDRSTGAFDINETETVNEPSTSVTDYQVLSDGHAVYSSVPRAYLGQGVKPWIAYPVQSDSDAEAAKGWPTGDLKEAEGPVVKLGTRVIEGVTATGYKVTVPSSAIVSHELPSLRESEVQDLAGVPSVRGDVWLDSSGRPVAISSSYTTEASTGETLQWQGTSHARYSTQPVTVTTPDPNEVTLVPNAAAADALMTTYARNAS